mgnify:CR=1 FL=1
MTCGKASAPGWMAAMLITGALLVAASAPADAQQTGNLRYVSGYDLVPNSPTTTVPTTLILYGFFPTGCGSLERRRLPIPLTS